MKTISALILAGTLFAAPVAAQNQSEPTAVNVEAISEETPSNEVTTVATATAVEAEDAQIDVSSTESVGLTDAFMTGVREGYFSDSDEEMTDFEEKMVLDHMDSIVGMVAIVFGIPALAVIAALVVILVYALKRNRRRNEVIMAAIQHNYKLPDSFYTGQKDSGNNERDPRKFYTAITLIAVGFSFIVYAIAENIGFFLLVGGIPLLIGIGKLLGFFFVAGVANRCAPHHQIYPQQSPQQPQPGPQTPPPFRPTTRN